TPAMNRRWVFAVILAGLAIGAQDPAGKKEYPKDGVFWAASWKEAYDEAFLRNVPIFVAFHQDDSEACLSMANSVYTDKKLIEASRMWVNVIAHLAMGHTIEATVKGKKVQVCGRYWNIPCSAHSTSFNPAGRKYGFPAEYPSYVFADAGGVDLARATGRRTIDELMQAMIKVMEKVPGDHLSAAEWLQSKTARADAEQAFLGKEWPKAIELYTRLSKFELPRVRKWGEEGLEKTGKEGVHQFREAAKLAQSGEKAKVKEGKKLLEKISKDFKPLEAAKLAEDLLKQLDPKPK
ncbi:MAG TPA: hypothetical protein VK661_02600, partial [Planctomycetota bacterium]|nr:hypothetical protein [Planctomycetota bacterium]